MENTKTNERKPTAAMEAAQSKLQEKLERIKPYLPKSAQPTEPPPTRWTVPRSLVGATVEPKM